MQHCEAGLNINLTSELKVKKKHKKAQSSCFQSVCHTNISYLCFSSCAPFLSKTFQILSIKDFLLLQIPLQTLCTLCGVMTSMHGTPTPSRCHTQTLYTTTDCASGSDMHLKVLVPRRRCLAEQVKEKPNSADAPVQDQTLPPLFCHSWGKDLRPVPVRTTKPQEKMGSMATEIVAFLLTISGWILVSSTLPTDYWKVSSVDGTVITTATFWSNLWKTCVTDSTGVSNCKDFPSMLALDGESWDDWCSVGYICLCMFFWFLSPHHWCPTSWTPAVFERMNDHRCKQMHLEPDMHFLTLVQATNNHNIWS